MGEYGQGFTAKYGNGACGDCRKPIATGDKVRFKYPGKILCHVDCASAKTAQATAGPKKTGQLWEECPRCGREPIYMPLHLCDHCWPKSSKPTEPIDTTCREPYRRGIGQGFGPGEDGDC